MNKYLLVLTFIVLIPLSFNSLHAQTPHREWNDLDADEHEVFGSEKEEKYPVINPFIEMEKWENHYSVSCLGLYLQRDYPRYSSTSCIPFLYTIKSKIDNRKYTAIPAIGMEFETDADYYSKTYCLFVYKSKGDNKSYKKSCLFPFFIWGGTASENYWWVLPLLLYHSSPSADTGLSLWINPLVFSRTHKTGGQVDEYYRWAPIIPITYHSVDTTGGHRNYLGLVDYSWITLNSKDSLERFWILPVMMWHAGSDGYTYIIPPVYLHNRYPNGDYYLHLFPVFAAWENNDSVITKQIITPLFGSREITDSETGNERYSNLFFPIISVFYRSSDANKGTHTNILWFIDQESDTEGTWQSLWITPVFFHEFKDWGYRVYLPFYVRLPGCSEENGVSFSLLHYHSWSLSHDTLWIWVYYHSEKYTGTGTDHDQFIPARSTSESYTDIFPLYWSWQNPDSRGTLVLPVYLNYRDKYTRLHVNLSGLAIRTFTGPFNPDLMARLEKKDDNWYLDTDFSWLYNVFSIQKRWPVTAMPGDNKTREEFTGSSQKDVAIKNRRNVTATPGGYKEHAVFTGPADRDISIKKRSTSREDSINYFGWDFLFGWMAYRHADTRFHWRVLPLAWFTYDEASADKLSMILPVYLSYYSEETKEGYFVLAPFYASQSEGESYKRGWLINLFWDEYDAAAGYREKTILWPFINWHHSPDRYGFRFFPLFWYRNWREGEDTLSRSISPLHYRMSIMDKTGSYTYRRSINPAYYIHESTGDTGGLYTFLSPIIPLFYYSETTVTDENGFEMNDKISISPFHIYTSTAMMNIPGQNGSSTLLVPVVPLFYRSTDGNYKHWNFLGLVDRCTDTDYSRLFILPFFYTSREGDVKYWNILGIVDRESGGITGGSSMFLPFYLWHGGEESRLTLPLLLLSFGSGKDWNSKFIAGTYWYNSPGYKRSDIFLLYDHKWYMADGNEHNEYNFLFTFAGAQFSPEILEMRAAWGALFKYRKNRNSGDYNFDALFWLAGADNVPGDFHNRLIPFWYYQKSSENDWYLALPPLLSYFSETLNGRYDLALLGALYYRDEDRHTGEDRTLYLGGILLDDVKKPERKYHAFGSMWGVLWNYETEEETNFTKFTILKGFYKHVNMNGKEYNSCLWF